LYEDSICYELEVVQPLINDDDISYRKIKKKNLPEIIESRRETMIVESVDRRKLFKDNLHEFCRNKEQETKCITEIDCAPA
jgi:hypothetical protein